mgnify:CR=1 FL=1
MIKFVLRVIFFIIISINDTTALSELAHWQPLSNVGLPIKYISEIKLAIAPDGTPYIAFLDSYNQATVMKFTNDSWHIVGIAGFSSKYTRDINLSFAPDGTPYVAYEDCSVGYYKATVMKFNGINWQPVGNLGFSKSQAKGISLAIAPDGTPYVIYADRDIYINVMKFK